MAARVPTSRVSEGVSPAETAYRGRPDGEAGRKVEALNQLNRGRSALRSACSGPPSTPLAASCLLDVPDGYAFVGESLPQTPLAAPYPTAAPQTNHGDAIRKRLRIA